MGKFTKFAAKATVMTQDAVKKAEEEAKKVPGKTGDFKNKLHAMKDEYDQAVQDLRTPEQIEEERKMLELTTGGK